MKFQLTSDFVQVEEEEGVEVERLDLEAGEHFTIVTSKGRVRAAIRMIQDSIKTSIDTSGAWAPTYGKWPVLASIFLINIQRHFHSEFPFSTINPSSDLITRLVFVAPAFLGKG